MLDRIKFAQEMANELNKSNFQTVSPIMAEYATAYATDGVQCGQANMLADVYSTVQSKQFSVKTYKDKFVSSFMKGEIAEDREFTDPIIERRISGVANPNADPSLVFEEVLNDIRDNERRSLNHYGINSTGTVLLGFSEDDDYFYFRLTEYDYVYDAPASVQEKTFTERSKNYLKHTGNRCGIECYNTEGVMVYEWVHPNNQAYTRCLKKRYDLRDADSMYFKIKKQKYTRPDDNALLDMVSIHF
ncbi:hypothetical protein EJP02_092 [Escherichia phage EJP2]|nr:hypothetical protein EJP02_092 [Escherichia phage EJP2]